VARGSGGVHVVTTTREYKGKTYKTHLLRRSYREGGKVKKETLANLTPLGDEIVATIRASLRGEKVGRFDEQFQVLASRAHGHVNAVRIAMRQLGFDALISSRSSRERDLVVAMVAARIVDPQSKLATVRSWANTTLPQSLGIEDATEDDLYAAMDWLVDRQRHIENKLAARHLQDGGLALYDLSSSYFEGQTCPLATLGHSRDGKKGTLQVNYGLLTDGRGCPVAISAFPGNTGDSTTLMQQVAKVREQFGIHNFAIVGDRGMITQKQIRELRDVDGVDWISALRPEAIRKLATAGMLQLGLFDERGLFEVEHPDFPGERLVACRNPELAARRARKRQSLLDATSRELEKVRGMVERGKLRARDAIGVRVGKVVNKYKVAKHFHLDIDDDAFSFSIIDANVQQEAALDGIYVIRTSLPQESLAADHAVRTYKSLAHVERAFRTIKTSDLQVRPIRHRLEDRVRAHLLLCMLAYYVQWHMMQAWRPLLFADEDLDAKAVRDPVAPAKRSSAAQRKVAAQQADDGTPLHSFRTLLRELAAVVRNTCRRADAAPDEPSFELDTLLTPHQQTATDLLRAITP